MDGGQVGGRPEHDAGLAPMLAAVVREGVVTFFEPLRIVARAIRALAGR